MQLSPCSTCLDTSCLSNDWSFKASAGTKGDHSWETMWVLVKTLGPLQMVGFAWVSFEVYQDVDATLQRGPVMGLTQQGVSQSSCIPIHSRKKSRVSTNSRTGHLLGPTWVHAAVASIGFRFGGNEGRRLVELPTKVQSTLKRLPSSTLCLVGF